MAALDKSIFRERAIEKYMRRREIHVILRLVSPRMFLFLWALLLLAVCGGALIWSIQVPVFVQGKGMVIQQKATKNQKTQPIFVLLLLPPGAQDSLKVGQPVSISIPTANITFISTVQKVQAGVMSPTDIRNQFNLPTALGETISGPSIVAMAQVQPEAKAHTYLGSQCEAQVKIGSQSALSMVPGLSNIPGYLDNTRKLFSPV
ncbi:MAG: hypothetical protein PVS3B1_35220 [Ktedonobacteraceae bacterium]